MVNDRYFSTKSFLILRITTESDSVPIYNQTQQVSNFNLTELQITVTFRKNPKMGHK